MICKHCGTEIENVPDVMVWTGIPPYPVAKAWATVGTWGEVLYCQGGYHEPLDPAVSAEEAIAGLLEIEEDLR